MVESVITPVRVALWGTGKLGEACVREIQRLDGIELVAAYSYSPTKIGRDVGDVLDIGTLGVEITHDIDTVTSSGADIVIYAPRDLGLWTDSDDDIQALLTAGLNVITAMPYRHIAETRGEEIFQRLQDAAVA